jgi:hypothetical protein
MQHRLCLGGRDTPGHHRRKPERLFPETASDVTLKVGYELLGFRTNACRYTDWASSRRWNSS